MLHFPRRYLKQGKGHEIHKINEMLLLKLKYLSSERFNLTTLLLPFYLKLNYAIAAVLHRNRIMRHLSFAPRPLFPPSVITAEAKAVLPSSISLGASCIQSKINANFALYSKLHHDFLRNIMQILSWKGFERTANLFRASRVSLFENSSISESLSSRSLECVASLA